VKNCSRVGTNPTYTQKAQPLKPFGSREIFTNLNTDIVIKVTRPSLRARERQEKLRQVRKKPDAHVTNQGQVTLDLKACGLRLPSADKPDLNSARTK